MGYNEERQRFGDNLIELGRVCVAHLLCARLVCQLCERLSRSITQCWECPSSGTHPISFAVLRIISLPHIYFTSSLMWFQCAQRRLSRKQSIKQFLRTVLVMLGRQIWIKVIALAVIILSSLKHIQTFYTVLLFSCRTDAQLSQWLIQQKFWRSFC